MRKSTWTAEQDRDAVMVLLPGSNSVFTDFLTQEEAEEFNRDQLAGRGRVHRNGRMKHLTDEEAAVDHDIRRMRILAGFRPDENRFCYHCGDEH